MVVEDSGVWVSVGDAPIVHLYHAPSATLMATVDCTRAVVDLLRGKGGYRRELAVHSTRPMNLLPAGSEGRGSSEYVVITQTLIPCN